MILNLDGVVFKGIHRIEDRDGYVKEAYAFYLEPEGEYIYMDVDWITKTRLNPLVEVINWYYEVKKEQGKITIN